MKQRIIAIFTIVTMLALTGCNQNDGKSNSVLDIDFSHTSSSSDLSSLNSENNSTQPSYTSTKGGSSSTTTLDKPIEQSSTSSSTAENVTSDRNNVTTTSTNSTPTTEEPISTTTESASQTTVEYTPPNEQVPSTSDKIAEKYPHLSADELKTAIDKFPLNNITLPDGSKVSKYDAISADNDVLIFGFAFYRNSSPIYNTTLTDPNLITYANGFWETTANVDELDKKIVTSYKKAVKGDRLDGGLSVDGAVCRIDSNGYITQSHIYLNGNITVSGIINYLPEDDMYVSEGTLFLRPDTTKATVPILYSSRDMVFQYWDGYSNGEDNPPFYMYFDGEAWCLGSIYDSQYDKYDFNYAFGEKTSIAATVTVGNLTFGSWEGISGEIIDIQF